MMDVTYGIDVRSSDDQYISIAEEAMHGLSVASIPGAFLVVRCPSPGSAKFINQTLIELNLRTQFMH
jgi:hypothetical protein